MKAFFGAIALALAALVSAAPASASVYIFNGDNTGGPTYNRGLSGIPSGGLSAVGTAVHYEVFRFSVSLSGAYDFLMTAIAPVNWDTFLTLYYNEFDPTLPLSLDIAASDDFPSIGKSGFNGINLTAGTPYYAVAAGFNNTDVGTYGLQISGPGNIIPFGAPSVPEPATWVMLILGVGMMGGLMRVQQRQRMGALTAA
ncbi:PEPxxWA-CTERM sorting domain-containing protein [Sphingomonas sp.]|uniref:PEPxxWA-CTERM sorting domain-containing protein n=1 Tax=Sphingomonas sp. TaxID=28214 RepID=UPI001B1D0FE2|nr:PEPxxWA-CTERM sorting domain-containing protein [Sphingomonas sp.]MBO9713007.1 PEPxxWA-CTERM sorting domain-containing protein [Sphingomonas sp.]